MSDPFQDDQVYIYKSDAHHTLIEGYPKTLKEELGVEGHVDAAFLCPSEHTVHIIQGELTQPSETPTETHPLTHFSPQETSSAVST